MEYLIIGSFYKKKGTKEKTKLNNNQKIEKNKEPFTLQAYEDLLKGMKYVSKQKNINKMDLNIPILLLSGDQDPVGEKAKGVIRVYHKMEKAGMKDLSIRLFYGVKHNILKEENKENVYNVVGKWLNKKIGRGEEK